ncbi:MAG: hypothetical protein IKA87_00470, partial [Lentisphaeria bacterium]|nr:hypothetical protein [Lentisphaeria bacterium]
MKKFLLSLLLLGSGVLCAALPPRIIEISGKNEKITNFEIVIGSKSRLMKFAAGEMQSFLQKSTGVKADIVSKPSGK